MIFALVARHGNIKSVVGLWSERTTSSLSLNSEKYILVINIAVIEVSYSCMKQEIYEYSRREVEIY